MENEINANKLKKNASAINLRKESYLTVYLFKFQKYSHINKRI
jgi:hypothetical protein